MTAKVLVAITCYRCAPQVKRVIRKFDKKLLDRISKVHVYDNQSPDDTIESAKKAIKELNISPEKFAVLRNDGNYGLGGSHKAAFNYALKHGYDYVAILHGDDQAETQELHLLLDEIEKDPELQAALGSRFMTDSRLKGYSFIRTWGNRIINLMFSILALRNSQDLGSGINIFKMSELADQRYLDFADQLTFNVDLLLDYFSKKSKIKFIPITWSETDQISNARAIQVGSTAVKTLLKWRLGIPKNYKTMKNSGYTSTEV